MGRKKNIAGNWKMYKTIVEAEAFIDGLLPLIENSGPDVYLAVPFTAIASAAQKALNSKIVIGAQNMNDATEGAFTGEISAVMLQEAGARFVVLGHSERRHIFQESNQFINKKIKRALSAGLQPILCIGETLEEREAGQTEAVLEQQLVECLQDISVEDAADIIIAYEPVWAIGTGQTATPEMAQNAHAFCRTVLAKIWNDRVASNTLIQYGGSVKPENAKDLLTQEDIDGALVGGAALQPESFSKIINYKN